MIHTLTIDFRDLMGDPPVGFRAYLWAERTDTTDPQAPLYAEAHGFVETGEVMDVVPNVSGRASVDLIATGDYAVPMDYVLRVGQSEIRFKMPDLDATLLSILAGSPAGPGLPITRNYYLAANPANTLTGSALVTALEAGTVSTTRSPIAAPTFTGDNYLYYAQQEAIADPTIAHALPGRRNQIVFWAKQTPVIEISGVRYNYWITRTVVYDSASGRQYDFGEVP